MQYVNCNLCNADNAKLLVVQNGFNIVRCTKCGLVYVNPRPNLKALNEMYNTYHIRNSKEPAAWEHLMEGNFRQSADILNKKIPEKGRVLDIGCGYGYFLDIMKDLGWDASGIDPSANTVSAAQRRGLNVIQNTIEGIDYPADSFDAVTMFYVLEHLTDPSAALEKISSILKPGGVLILRIPHTTPIVRLLSVLGIKNNLYDAPFHLYDFSPRSITEMLNKAGFSSIKITPGMPTLPQNMSERITSVLSTDLARMLFALSLGSFLLPGVSKTITATKA